MCTFKVSFCGRLLSVGFSRILYPGNLNALGLLHVGWCRDHKNTVVLVPYGPVGFFHLWRIRRQKKKNLKRRFPPTKMKT